MRRGRGGGEGEGVRRGRGGGEGEGVRRGGEVWMWVCMCSLVPSPSLHQAYDYINIKYPPPVLHAQNLEMRKAWKQEVNVIACLFAVRLNSDYHLVQLQ